MSDNNTWDTIPSRETIDQTIAALKANGINAQFVETAEQAKQLALSMIPEGSEIMTMTSETTRISGLADELNESGKYKPVRDKLGNPETSPSEKRKLGGGPDFTVGSVHAVTQDGKALIASNTGSQLGAYAYGAGKVIWLVGAQKLVKDFDDGMKRIYEYVLPLESERAKKAYGVAGSFVSKLLVINQEINPDRLHMIIIGKKIGF